MRYHKSILIIAILLSLTLLSVNCSGKKNDSDPLPTGTIAPYTGTNSTGTGTNPTGTGTNPTGTGTTGGGTGIYTTTSARISPVVMTPPVGLTFYASHYSNIDLAFLEGLKSQLIETSNLLWQLSEGQIFFNKIIVEDNLLNDPEMTLNDVDLIQYYPADFVGPGIANCDQGSGRCGRRVQIQTPSYKIINHELGHFLYSPKWMWNKGLADEYNGMGCDCIMSSSSIAKYCHEGSHDLKWDLQPSCCTILNESYPNFHWDGTATAPGPAPTPEVILIDNP